jgi:hypothetical protein
MKTTTTSNSYLMSRDFEDGHTRMAAGCLEARINALHEATPILVHVLINEIVRGEEPYEQDVEIWLGELEVYSLLGVIKRDDQRDWLRTVAAEVLFQCIRAFVDERRKPPQTPTLINGEETYECVTLDKSEMLRSHTDDAYEFNEVGAIWMMLEALQAGTITIPPSEALQTLVESFDVEPAKRQRISKWSPIGGNGPSHLA